MPELQKVMKQLDSQAMQWANNTRFTTTDVTEAISEASHAGWDLDKILEGIPAAMNISMAGSMSLSEGLEYLVDITNAAGLSFEDLGSLTDYWAYAANKSSTTIPEMGAAMQKMGATMSFVKGDMAGLTTMLAVLANNGTKGTEAGTLLRNSMIRLLAPTQTAAEAMDALNLSSDELEEIYSNTANLEKANAALEEAGFSAYDANGNLKSFLTTFEDLNRATKGMTEQERNEVLSAIFPSRTITGALALLDAAGKGWDGMYDNIRSNGSGYAEYAAETMESGLGGALRHLESVYNVTQTRTGKALSGLVETGAEGISGLLERIALEAEVMELKANPNRPAKGTVIEARLDRTRGPIATLLIQNGTLNQGDVIIAGTAVGRVRVMTDDKGRTVKTAGPSVPVEITGLADVPAPGDEFNAVSDERMARELVEQRRQAAKDAAAKLQQKVTLDNLFARMQEGEMKELPLIVKADVQGSAEAVKASLEKISNEEVRVRVIHTGVGAINESDVLLASTSGAIIVGFNVRADAGAQASIARSNVDIRYYRVIYDAIDEIESAMKGMLAPKYEEVVIGHAEVRMTYKVSAIGTIAGCMVKDGKVTRDAQVRVLRDNIVIHEGEIGSLQRFKDAVKEVTAGYECGMSVVKFNDIKEGDIFECFAMQEIKR